MEFIQTFGPFGVFFIMFALGLNLTIETLDGLIKHNGPIHNLKH